MNQTMTKWMPATLLIGGLIALTGCSHDASDYTRKPYSVTDQQRKEYAEQVLGVTIDAQQDWVLTQAFSVKVTADADVEGISSVAVLDGNPFAEETCVLAQQKTTKGQTAVLSFRAPTDSEVLYAACMNSDGQALMARPFLVGTDTEVSFIDKLVAATRAMTRSVTSTNLDSSPFYTVDYSKIKAALQNVLPQGKDNRTVVSEFLSSVQVRQNPYTVYDLPIAFFSGNSNANEHLLYTWYPVGQPDYQESFLIEDHYDGAVDVPTKDPVTKRWKLNGHFLQCRQADLTIGRQFTPGDRLWFQLTDGNQVMDGDRVKVFSYNGYVFIACEDGNDWDYNDRVFWIPEGQERVEKPGVIPPQPEPTKPQLWTYAWEDNTMEEHDVCDYDMNDCVLEVQEHADDPSKIDVTLVAVGATRDLWLGFENKQGKNYNDFKPVFDAELHQVLGVTSSTMVNTGGSTRTVAPVTITVDKPAGFDFQTNSFVLGAKVKENMLGIYENDYYMLHISTAGTDPHGIVIPGKWQWPTEKTCIKNAYATAGHEFNTWAGDRTKAKDWYRFPVTGKVVK